MRGANLRANLTPSIDFAPDLPNAVTDENGRVKQRLLPGSSYSLHVEGAEIDLAATINRDLSVEPGQTINLGDLRRSGSKFEPIAISDGKSASRERSPSGRPAVEVSVVVSHILTPKADVDRIIKSASFSSGVYTNWPAWVGGNPTTVDVLTDAEGHIRLEGQGAERFVRLEAKGGGIGAARLAIVTRATPTQLQPHGANSVREGRKCRTTP